jgi:glycosyltransferase involved in cell wall biosynthesis
MFRGADIRYMPEFLIKSRVHKEQSTHKIISHIEECDELWIHMIKNVTKEEMQKIDGSELMFYKEEMRFLQQTPYKKAYEYTKELYNNKAGQLRNAKISVIIPFKNRIELLLEAIESVQSQTYSNVEIIIVDDKSDESLELLLEFIEKDHRIKYILSDRGGAAAARNIGIEHSIGEYIAFLDSDDLFLPEKLETQLNYMLDKGYAISHTSYNRINWEGHFLEIVNTHHMHDKIFPTIIAGCTIATPTIMAERDLFNEFNFFESFTIGEDVCLWIDIAYSYEFGALKEPLTNVRVSETSAFQDKDKQYIGCCNIIRHIFNHSEYMLYRDEVSALLKYFTNLLSCDIDAHNAKISFMKKILFFFTRAIWKIVTILHLQKFIKSSRLYSKLYECGVYDT